MKTESMIYLAILSTFLFLFSGCSSAPPKLIEPSIELTGQPNETVIFSVEDFIFESSGRSTSHSGSSSYGPIKLDENGKHQFQFERPVHGFRYRIVTLNDNAVTLTATAKDGTQMSQHVVAGKFEHGTAEHGKTFNDEPGHPLHDSPESTIYEAEQYLKRLNERKDGGTE